jgi:hypothetical protein
MIYMHVHKHIYIYIYIQLAVVLGQRRRPVDTHPLRGSVARRIGLFSNFADAALCASVERPERVVEMTMSHDEYNDLA